MSLERLLRGWGDELPLHEASYQLDPPPEKWIARAAFKTAVLKPGMVYEKDFCATEEPGATEAPAQTAAEMDKEAEKLNVLWPR